MIDCLAHILIAARLLSVLYGYITLIPLQVTKYLGRDLAIIKLAFCIYGSINCDIDSRSFIISSGDFLIVSCIFFPFYALEPFEHNLSINLALPHP